MVAIPVVFSSDLDGHCFRLLHEDFLVAGGGRSLRPPMENSMFRLLFAISLEGLFGTPVESNASTFGKQKSLGASIMLAASISKRRS